MICLIHGHSPRLKIKLLMILMKIRLLLVRYFGSLSCISKWILIIERKKFFTCDQRIDENIDSYVTELKNLVSSCEFDEIHESMTTFRIDEGINSNAVRDRLLRHRGDLSFTRVIDICRAEEITREQIKSVAEHTSDI